MRRCPPAPSRGPATTSSSPSSWANPGERLRAARPTAVQGEPEGTRAMAVSCTPRQNSSRLLDARTGWAAAARGGRRGLDAPAGLRLGSPPGSEVLVHVADLADCLLPAGLTVDQRGRLTRGLPGRLQGPGPRRP